MTRKTRSRRQLKWYTRDYKVCTWPLSCTMPIRSSLIWVKDNRCEDKINSAQYEAKTALDLNLRFLLAWATDLLHLPQPYPKHTSISRLLLTITYFSSTPPADKSKSKRKRGADSSVPVKKGKGTRVEVEYEDEDEEGEYERSRTAESERVTAAMDFNF